MRSLSNGSRLVFEVGLMIINSSLKNGELKLLWKTELWTVWRIKKAMHLFTVKDTVVHVFHIKWSLWNPSYGRFKDSSMAVHNPAWRSVSTTLGPGENVWDSDSRLESETASNTEMWGNNADPTLCLFRSHVESGFWSLVRSYIKHIRYVHICTGKREQDCEQKEKKEKHHRHQRVTNQRVEEEGMTQMQLPGFLHILITQCSDTSGSGGGAGGTLLASGGIGWLWHTAPWLPEQLLGSIWTQVVLFGFERRELASWLKWGLLASDSILYLKLRHLVIDVASAPNDSKLMTVRTWVNNYHRICSIFSVDTGCVYIHSEWVIVLNELILISKNLIGLRTVIWWSTKRQ